MTSALHLSQTLLSPSGRRAGWACGVLVVLGLATLQATKGVQAQGMPPLVERFEGAPSAQLPPEWTAGSFGELRSGAALDARRPQEGDSSLRLTVGPWSSGAGFVRRAAPVRGETTYSLTFWMRGAAAVPVTVAVRRPDGAIYFGDRFAAGPEWRRCTLQATCGQNDPTAVLEISLSGPGQVWIDQLRLGEGEIPVEPEPRAPTPRPGNRIFNSSFELGTDGWTIPEQVALVRNASPDGEQFARLLANPFPLQARPFFARAGQTYSVSVFMRSQRPGARALVSLVEVGGAVRREQVFDLTAEWKRFTFNTTLPCREYPRYFLQIAPAEEQHGLDVDAVQVEEGAQTPYAPAAPLEVSHGLGRAQLFPQPNEGIGLPCQLYAPGRTTADQAIQLRLEGFYGETLFLQQFPVKPEVTHAEVPLRVRMPGSGCVRLSVEALVDRTVVSRSEVMLTALPPLDPRPRPDSFFGAHGSTGVPGEWHTPTIAARAGVRWWRLHDLSAFTQWAIAEPERNRFIWFDREVDALRERGMSILGVFARTPAWAGEDPGGERTDPSAWPPARIGDLANYTRQVATHYKGRIAAYELWNEPWARAFWAGTPERYAEIAKAAGATVREADPAARVVGGCFWVPQPTFTDRVLAKGLLPAVDAVSYHQYTQPDTVAFRFAGQDQVTQWHRALRGKVDLAGGQRAEIWNTEGGVASPSYYSWLGAEEESRAAARTLAKTLVLARAAGVRRYFYYHVWQEMGGPRLFDWLHQNNWSLLDYDGAGKPSLAAFATCTQHLEGAEPVHRQESRDTRAYVFRRGRDCVMVAWSPTALSEARPLSLGLPPVRVRALNLMGNLVGAEGDGARSVLALRNEPVFITLRDTTPEVAIRSLQPAAAKPAAPARPAPTKPGPGKGAP